MPISKQEEYKKIFFQESDELLQQMNKSLLVLEKDPKDENALNEIFRAAHTIKGMSSSMGYKAIAELSHKMEDILSQMRSHAISTDEASVGVLFRSFDILGKMVSEVQSTGEVALDPSEIISQINSIALKKIEFKEEMISEGLSLNVFEKRTLFRAKTDGYDGYEVWVTLEKNCVLKSVRAFMVFRNLHSIGEVIKSFPDSTSLAEEKFGLKFGCVLISKESQESIEDKTMEILEISSVEIQPIDVKTSWENEVAEKTVTSSESSLPEGPVVLEQTKKIKSVRVDIERLDKLMNLVEELAISRLKLSSIGQRILDADLKNVTEQFGRLTDDLQNVVMQTRLVPVAQIFDRFPRLVRDLAKNEKKSVKFEMLGADIELDRAVVDEIGDPLMHILRNAVDHGIELPKDRRSAKKNEEATITLSARRERGYVLIEVIDDGRGIDADEIVKVAVERGLVSSSDVAKMTNEEKILITTLPGFSTKGEISDVSGRGVGLDVVKQNVEKLGGVVLIESKKGIGTHIQMRLPITTSVVKSLLVSDGGRFFAIPISSVVEIVVTDPSHIKKIESQETVVYRDKVLPMLRLSNIIGCENVNVKKELNVVVIESGVKLYGVAVEKLINQQDIVVKPLGREFKGVRGIAGGTILGDGQVALVLDSATLC